MKYFVINNLGMYETSVESWNTLEEAKKDYCEKLTYSSNVHIAKELEVEVIVKE